MAKLARGYGLTVADTPVCPGHSDPLTFLTQSVYDRPALSVVHGPRGGGKSYLSGFATWVDSLRYPGHATKILGGSLAQSQQIYAALSDFDHARPGSLSHFGKESAGFVTGSAVSVLAASAKSVRGPHVPSLKLDEVDEIPADLRDAALGMCMRKGGVSASVSMTSTWHRVGGPMGELKARAETDGIPWHTFCAFEVLERCPEERSGPNLERCPDCPLVKWCHDTEGTPKAKRSNGHYAIDALSQKAMMVSARAFESDYLCKAPRSAGLWFTGFDPARHVGKAAEYSAEYPVHLAVDSGVFTGAVAFQVRPRQDLPPLVTVFLDYLSEGASAYVAAGQVLQLLGNRNGPKRSVWTDPAGGSRTAIGPTVLGEYQRANLTATPWPGGSVADGLALIEALLDPASGPPALLVHPSCTGLIAAFSSYRRAARAGQWCDWPEDPQHPWEDYMDSLRGGLRAALPDGLKVKAKMRTRRLTDLLY